MNTLKMKWLVLFGITAMITFVSPVLSDYEIPWHTIDGGGGTSSDATYILIDTISQHDAAYSSGDDYELLGGFWPGEPLCFVEFEDFARFAEHWLDSGSDLSGDLDGNNVVDIEDLDMFVYQWLYYCPFNWPLK